jgi:hypothetical protein
MAYYHDRQRNDVGTLNSLFMVATVLALLGFAVAATYLAG